VNADNEKHSIGSAPAQTPAELTIRFAGALSIESVELSLADFGRAIAFMGIESTF
jgi:hypothetical protein